MSSLLVLLFQTDLTQTLVWLHSLDAVVNLMFTRVNRTVTTAQHAMLALSKPRVLLGAFSLSVQLQHTCAR